MMDRSNKYVAVNEREWAEYQRAPVRSVERRLLHIKIFYGGSIHHTDIGTASGFALHPLPYGTIPEGYAVTEANYVNETKWTVRSERETAETKSNSRGMSL